MIDKYLKVSEVAEILQVSQMTVIRLCRDGRLPFTRIGTMKRIREIDLEYYLLNPNKKPRKPEPERPVYDGLPPDQNGFETNEEERQQELHNQCVALDKRLKAEEAEKASMAKAPEPFVDDFRGKPATGPYPSGFAELLNMYE